MKLLLDTHIWIWSLVDPAKLSSQVARELESEENERWLSPISVWELCLLFERGRFVLEEDLSVWVSKAIAAAALHEAPLTHAVALEMRSVRLPHRDPADRCLVATARVFELTLVTADKRLMGSQDWKVLANR